jgi:hypothetical protein
MFNRLLRIVAMARVRARLARLERRRAERISCGNYTFPPTYREEKARLTKRLRELSSLTVVLVMNAACALTPTQQKVSGLAVGALIVGAIAAHNADSGKLVSGGAVSNTTQLPCHPQRDGTCR